MKPGSIDATIDNYKEDEAFYKKHNIPLLREENSEQEIEWHEESMREEAAQRKSK